MCNDPVYMLFAGYDNYPCGGMRDFEGNFQTIADAVAQASAGEYEWWHVVEKDSVTIVEQS